MVRKNWIARLSRLSAALFVGAFFFFDIIGVFGLSAAIAGLIAFVASSVAIFRITTLKGAAQ